MFCLGIDTSLGYFMALSWTNLMEMNAVSANGFSSNLTLDSFY